LLGGLPQLEYVYFFANQRISSLWDMTGNESLTGLGMEDFSRLSSVEGIGTAPALREFRIGNVVWNKMVIDSFMPLADTGIERLSFTGRAISDNDLSFIEKLPNLKTFDFATNLFTTEQVAWIVANYPHLEGFALKPSVDCEFDGDPSVIIVGKRKPILRIGGNEARIGKYVRAFEDMKEKYKGISYHDAFDL